MICSFQVLNWDSKNTKFLLFFSSPSETWKVEILPHNQSLLLLSCFNLNCYLKAKCLQSFVYFSRSCFLTFTGMYQLTISQLLFDKRTTLLEICRVIKTNQFYCRFWMEQLELYPTNNHFTISILLDFWVSELGLDPFCR